MKKSYSLAAVCASWLADCLVGDGEVDLDVAGAGRDGLTKAAGDDGAGKAGLGPN